MSSKKPSGSWFAKQRLKKEKESKKLANNINKWLISETINANNVVVAPPEVESPGISSNPLNIPEAESAPPKLEPSDKSSNCLNISEVESVPPELKPSGISSNHLNISEVESEQIDNVDYCIENNQIDINCDINFNDPGTWPPITSSIRTLLVEKGPQHYEPKNIPIDTAAVMLKGLISSIMNIRNNRLEISINKAKATASFLNISSQFEEKRSKIIKRHFDDSPNDEPKLKAEQELKRECYLAMDSIISNFSWRYEQMNKVVSDFGFLTVFTLYCLLLKDLVTYIL
ncbi:hypothetical protein ACI65C_005137 [Semiaphis heraclei]